MPSEPFPIDHTQISKCVKETKLFNQSHLRLKETSSSSSSSSSAAVPSTHKKKSKGCCQLLYEKHQSYYKRPSAHTHAPGRFDIFMENVEFVHNHNNNEQSDFDHYITLNQFSDLFQNELPFAEGGGGGGGIINNMMHPDNDESSSFEMKNFDDSNIIQSIHNFFTIDDPSSELYKPKNTKIPTSKTYRSVHRQNKDQWMVLEHSKHQRHHLYGNSQNCTKTNCGKKNVVKKGSFAYGFQSSDDSWERHLDWATDNNPDGVAIVHSPTDQGTCGSCWSFAAIGSLEANAARNAAMEVFYNEMPQIIQAMSSSWKHNDTAIARREIHNAVPLSKIHQAVQKAQRIENQAFNLAQLSIQELIDCDTKHNQGCIGGNPVMAFPYIHKHGLVSKYDYPYDGVQNKQCLKDSIAPVATTDSWGVLREKDESAMEFAVRHLGPISCGFNGADKSFLSYSGGIYDSNVCTNHPNHAMLITGYGEEKDKDGNTVKYWIARNSWGTGWGEKGFVKIKRKEKTRSSGVCGIAKNPSIAVGGYLIDIDNHITLWQQEYQADLLSNQTDYVRDGIWHSVSKIMLVKNTELNIQQEPLLHFKTFSVLMFAIAGIVFSIWRMKKIKINSADCTSNPILLHGREDSIEQTSLQKDFSFQAKHQYGSI